MTDVTAIALFCEDVREEKAGTVTIVGVLSDGLAVPAFPGMLAKLALYVRFNVRIDATAKAADLYLSSPNAPSVLVAHIDQSLIVQAQEEARRGGSDIAGLYSVAMFSPFPVLAPGRIVVELDYGGERTQIGTLNIIGDASTLPESAQSSR